MTFRTVLSPAPLSAVVHPDQQTVDLGGTATFRCVPSGHPISTLVWLKDGKVLRSGDARVQVSGRLDSSTCTVVQRMGKDLSRRNADMGWSSLSCSECKVDNGYESLQLACLTLVKRSRWMESLLFFIYLLVSFWNGTVDLPRTFSPIMQRAGVSKY